MVDGQQVNRSGSWALAFWEIQSQPGRSLGRSLLAYHVLDMSWTAPLMLRWHDELEPDPRLLAYAVRYADALVALQDEKGYFPAWLDQDTLAPLDIIRESPETSLSVTFCLSRTNCARIPNTWKRQSRRLRLLSRRSCRPAGGRISRRIGPLCGYGRDELPGNKVARNNMFKQCNFSMFWTAEALYHMYKTNGDKRYMIVGQRVLDEMLMTQASWRRLSVRRRSRRIRRHELRRGME